MDHQHIQNILEACLLVAGKAMSINQLDSLFDEDIDRPDRTEIKQALLVLQTSYEGRGIELVEVASGWRLQTASSMEHWVGRMFEEKPPRYSRALLETLVLIAYRQPITRGEIEDVRGVAVSSNIIKTLQERDWIKEMGYKDVPGKPALWGTTKSFLDYFNLKRLDELPTLAEARDLAEIDAALEAEMGVVEGAAQGVAANDAVDDSEESAQDSGAEVVEGGESGEVDELRSGGDDTVETDHNNEAAENSGLANLSLPESDSTPSDSDSDLDRRTESRAVLSNEVSQNMGEDQGKGQGEDQGEDQDEGLVAMAAGLAGGVANEDSDLSALVEDYLEEQPDEDSSSKTSKPQPTEISAHDVVVEEWKPANKSEQDQEPIVAAYQQADEGDEGGEGGEDNHGAAESQLRQVIEEFADEHQQQLDAQNSLSQRASTAGVTDQRSIADRSVNDVELETASPSHGTGDEQTQAQAQPTQLFGVSGSIDTEINADADGKASGSDDAPEPKSAEP